MAYEFTSGPLTIPVWLAMVATMVVVAVRGGQGVVVVHQHLSTTAPVSHVGPWKNE